MTITADPQRMGDHVVLTVTLPTHWVILQHHGHEVRIEVNRLLQFDERFGGDPDEYRYRRVEWSWPEEMVLREVGWLTMLGLHTMWPTEKLHEAVEAWRKSHAT